ncbi:MAG: type II secretion system protein [Limisphaerales bacterium]
MPKAKQKLQGFTIVEILVVVAVIGLLVSIAMPNFIRTRAIAQQNVCMENLYQLESAKQIYALEKGKSGSDSVDMVELVEVERYMKAVPRCPSGGEYDLKTFAEESECSLKDELKHEISQLTP